MPSSFGSGATGGGPRAEIMAKAAQHLTEEEIAALAAYYASLPPDPWPQ